MTITDQQVRAEFIFLQVQSAMDFLKTKPTRAEVEARSATMRAHLIASEGKTFLGNEDLFKRPGAVLGRCSSTIHSIIHNFTLGDIVERNSRTLQGTDRSGTGSGPAGGNGSR